MVAVRDAGNGPAASLGAGFVLLDGSGMIVGDDGDTDRVYFAYTKDAVTYEFGAISMAWSDKFGGLMTLWAYFGTDTPASYLYVTLATTTLIPGNILGQDGVTAYDFTGAPAVNIPLFNLWATCVNFCVLPRPTDFEPATITPEPPTCDDIYAGCEAPGPLQITVSFGEDCTIPAGDNPYIESRYGTVINGPWTLENALTFDSSQVVCVSYDKSGFVILLVDFTAYPFTGGGDVLDLKYAAAVADGLLYRKYEQAATAKTEFWVCELAAKLACIDGLIYLIEFHVVTLRFDFLWDTDHWVVNSIGGSPDCLDNYNDPDDVIHKYPARLFPDCSTVLQTDTPTVFGMVTLFTYDVCGTPSTSGLEVDAYIDIPPP